MVDATFELPFLEIDAAGGDDRREGLYSLATPFASRSSLTVGSRPRKSKNWEGVPFGEASLSPLFIVGCCFTTGALPKVDISAWFQLYELLVRCVGIVPIWGDWHLKHLNLPGKLTKVHLGELVEDLEEHGSMEQNVLFCTSIRLLCRLVAARLFHD